MATPQAFNAPAVSSSSQVFLLNNATNAAATLAFGGSFSGSTASTLTLFLAGTNGGANVVSGNISNGTGGATSLRKSGKRDRNWILSGTNSYTGTTYLDTSSGITEFAKRASLYGGDATKFIATNITVQTGATLALNVGGTGEFTSADITTLDTMPNVSGNFGFRTGSFLGLDTASGNFTHVAQIKNDLGGHVIGLTKLGATR